MSVLARRPIFQAFKAVLRARKISDEFTTAEVRLIDAGIDAALAAIPSPTFGAPPTTGRHVSPKGIALMHEFEGCKLDAYPDPGSRDGNPWTIGFGSTGPGIHKGVTWTQEQADERFAADLAKFAAQVDKAIGSAPTTPNQFSAMVALAYNIGIAGFIKSTVLRKHKAEDYHGAAAAFSMWSKNDGKIMRGLVRRRAAEADLYDDA